MNYLCDYILKNVDVDVDKTIYYDIFSFDEFYDLDDCANIISYYLDIEKSEIIINNDNLFRQRSTVFSCKFKNRQCEFYEHYGTQRDYTVVRMLPVV
jgi:hypothetical protein